MSYPSHRLDLVQADKCPQCLSTKLELGDPPLFEEDPNEYWSFVRCIECEHTGPRGGEWFDPVRAWNLRIRTDNTQVWEFTAEVRDAVTNLILPMIQDRVGWHDDMDKAMSPARFKGIELGVMGAVECMALQLVRVLSRQDCFRTEPKTQPKGSAHA